jgi:hypothetical protein
MLQRDNYLTGTFTGLIKNPAIRQGSYYELNFRVNSFAGNAFKRSMYLLASEINIQSA